MKITLPAGDIAIEISQEDFDEQVKNAIQRHLEYAIRNQVDTHVRQWTEELIIQHRDAVIEKLKPEVDKRLAAVRIATTSNY